MIYSLGMREKIIRVVEEGEKISEVAKMFKLSRNTIYRWLKKVEIKGRAEDEKPRRGHKKLDPEKLMEYVRANNQLMRKDYAKHFSVTPKSISDAFLKLKITRKKRQIFTESGMKKKEEYIWRI